jgi:hypothetical protein
MKLLTVFINEHRPAPHEAVGVKLIKAPCCTTLIWGLQSSWSIIQSCNLDHIKGHGRQCCSCRQPQQEPNSPPSLQSPFSAGAAGGAAP